MGRSGYSNGILRYPVSVVDHKKQSQSFDPAELDVKADKVVEATSGHVAGLDEEGNLTDSNIPAGSVMASSTVRNVVVLTQAQYDALATKDLNTEYNIIESV